MSQTCSLGNKSATVILRPTSRDRVFTIGLRKDVATASSQGLAGLQHDISTMLSFAKEMPIHHIRTFLRKDVATQQGDDAVIVEGDPMEDDPDEVWERSMAPYACCLEKALKRAQVKGRIPADSKLLLPQESRMSANAPHCDETPWMRAQIDTRLDAIYYIVDQASHS